MVLINYSILYIKLTMMNIKINYFWNDKNEIICYLADHDVVINNQIKLDCVVIYSGISNVKY